LYFMMDKGTRSLSRPAGSPFIRTIKIKSCFRAAFVFYDGLNDEKLISPGGKSLHPHNQN